MVCDNKPIVLASQSPARLELMTIAHLPHTVSPQDIDETVIKGEKPADLVRRLALGKARSAAQTHKDCFILAADTVVSVGVRILNKPVDRDDAERQLRLLSGRSHLVMTGLCLVTPEGREVFRRVVTRVDFKRLADWEIETFLDTEQWQGKAGSYALQGHAAVFMKSIQGSHTNVIGLPLHEVRNLLIGNGYKI